MSTPNEQKRLDEEKKRAAEEAERHNANLKINEKAMVRSADIFELGKLDESPWYMGLLTREEVESMLTKRGDFAVRATGRQNLIDLVLSVRGKDDSKNVFHITLICNKDTKKWSLQAGKGAKAFKSVQELVEYYQKNPLPMPTGYDKLQLQTACVRPRWLFRHGDIIVHKKQLLGSGNFCKVYAGELKSGIKVAVKICHSNENADGKKTVEEIDREELAREELIKEGTLMSSVRNLYVIRFYGIRCDKLPVMIAMELCLGGSLLNHLVKYKDEIQVPERLKYCIEAAKGMTYLHKKNIIHRDLAARNCLIGNYGNIKIADFGLSQFLDGINQKTVITNEQIPLRWMAPESIRHDPEFSSKSDVWSYGVLLFEIFNNGQKPWEDWVNKKIATYIRRVEMPDFPDKAPPQIVVLVKEKIWVLEPAKRPKFSSIVNMLSKLENQYPCPEPQKTTLSKINGIEVLSKADLLAKETQEICDNPLESSRVRATGTQENLPTGKGEVCEQRDPTVEEPLTRDDKKSVAINKRAKQGILSRDGTQERVTGEASEEANKVLCKPSPTMTPVCKPSPIITPKQAVAVQQTPGIREPTKKSVSRRKNQKQAPL